MKTSKAEVTSKPAISCKQRTIMITIETCKSNKLKATEKCNNRKVLTEQETADNRNEGDQQEIQNRESSSAFVETEDNKSESDQQEIKNRESSSALVETEDNRSESDQQEIQNRESSSAFVETEDNRSESDQQEIQNRESSSAFVQPEDNKNEGNHQEIQNQESSSISVSEVELLEQTLSKTESFQSNLSQQESTNWEPLAQMPPIVGLVERELSSEQELLLESIESSDQIVEEPYRRSLPVIPARFHGSGCVMELSVMEKHKPFCMYENRDNNRNNLDDRAGSYECIGRLLFHTCDPWGRVSEPIIIQHYDEAKTEVVPDEEEIVAEEVEPEEVERKYVVPKEVEFKEILSGETQHIDIQSRERVPRLKDTSAHWIEERANVYQSSY